MYCTVLHFTALHCTALHWTALHCNTLCCTALLQGSALKGTAPNCTPLQCPALSEVLLLRSFYNIQCNGYRVDTFEPLNPISTESDGSLGLVYLEKLERLDPMLADPSENRLFMWLDRLALSQKGFWLLNFCKNCRFMKPFVICLDCLFFWLCSERIAVNI